MYLLKSNKLELNKKEEDLMNKKSGFTLAEVLVTLMIIGVIAAMTIPSLMQSTSQQEYKAAFKKAVSMINQAVTLNYALDGRDGTDYTGTSFFDLMTQRLNVMSSTAANSELYTADGMYFKAGKPKDGSGQCTVAGGGGENNICAEVTVDVNGAKGPNKVTESTDAVYDIFTIAVYPQKALPRTETQSQVLYGNE